MSLEVKCCIRDKVVELAPVMNYLKTARDNMANSIFLLVTCIEVTYIWLIRKLSERSEQVYIYTEIVLEGQNIEYQKHCLVNRTFFQF